MQGFLSRWLTPPLYSPLLRRMKPGMRLLAFCAVLGLGRAQVPGQPRRPARLSQGQAANQFLRAVLRADYAGAYGRLAPEVRRAVSLKGFETAARPLWKSGQPRRQAIELYKLGLRLEDSGRSQLFYSFSFVADSALKTPPVLLEVTFRDTAARAVLGFGLRNLPGAIKKVNAPIPAKAKAQ